MDTQRCPMCGQANPPHLEVCQYCQARLKPLWSEPPEGKSSAIEEGITKNKAPIQADEPLLPDWLLSSRSQMTEGEAFNPEELGEETPILPEGTQDREDILNEIFSGGASAEEDVPEWLRSLRAGRMSDEERQSQSDRFSEPEEPIPFWLDFDQGEAKDVSTEVSSEQREVPPFTEVPFEEIGFDQEWLELQSGAAQGLDLRETGQAVPPFEGIEPFDLEEVSTLFPPDKYDEEKETEIAEGKETLTALPTEEGDWMSEIPPWLETLPGQEWVEGETVEPEMPPEFLQGVVPPFVETDETLSEIEFPAWLADVERTIEPELDTVIEGLTPPTDEVLIEEKDQEVSRQEPQEILPKEEIPIEVVGPLHGLRGVLPAEPLVAEQKKPAKALSELLVTEKQRAQAELFLKLIEEEGKPKPIPPTKRAKPHTLWKVLIFLSLFAAAMVGLILRPFSSVPQELSVAVLDAMQAVNQLPAQPTILLIVDIEGGDFAEMQATTQALLDQMMSRGAFFVLVSANQNGALQADRLLRQVSQVSGHSYQPGSGWLNLGYLPGGVTGMQAFAQSMTDILPNSVDGEAAWEAERLQKIRSLADFDLVLVITEDSTRARQWIEQLKGGLAETRLMFAVSAQVEPVLLPYYQADPRQVQSVIAGIRDGAIYETQSARPGWAMQLWDTYTLVALTGVVLISLGAFIYLLLGLLVRPKAKVEEKPA
ncbi:MAG: hypothetical protein N3D16_07505 [Anaerolineales bacterium]|nr:hypothetical protein [Anaerolineales bacterium]